MSLIGGRCVMVLGLIMGLAIGMLAEDDQGTTPYPDLDEYGTPIPIFRTPSPEEWDPSPCEMFRGRTYHDNGIRCKDISSPEELVSIFARLKTPAGLYMGFFDLEDSTLKILPDGVFGNATFAVVRLVRNSLEVVERNVLKGMKKTLQRVRVEGNQIKRLDFLFEAKNLRTLRIRKEKCEEIDDFAFANFSSLGRVEIDGCPLHTIGNYAFANTNDDSEIFIIDCLIKSLGNYAFANGSHTVVIVNSQYARLMTKLGDYAFSRNQRSIITLMEVKITDDLLSLNTFAGVNGLFSLSNTRLTTMKEELFSRVSENSKVLISGDLKCDQSMDWIILKANIEGRPRFRCECEDGKSLAEHTCSRIPETCKWNSTGAAYDIPEIFRK